MNFSQWVMSSGNSNLTLISDLMFLVNKRLQSRRSQIPSRLWLESNTQGNEDPGFALGATITSRVRDGYVEMVIQSPQGEVKILPSNNHCLHAKYTDIQVNCIFLYIIQIFLKYLCKFFQEHQIYQR